MKGKAWLARLTRLTSLALICSALFLSASPSSVFAADPVVTSSAASDTTESSAVLNGIVTSFGTFGGPNVYLSFDYASQEYYNAHSFTYDKHSAEITWKISDGLTSFSTAVSALANGTTYDFRAKVRFNNSYVYGTNLTLQTTMLYPDRVPQVHTLQAYRNLLETNDCLVIILADIPYNVTPSVPVSRAYVWSLMNGSTELGYNAGYAMNDNGYGFNIFSLYFTAADAIAWGNNTTYQVMLSGSPDVFVGTIAPSYDATDDPDYAFFSDSWVSASNYHTKLAADLLDTAKTLEQEWQIVLLDEQDTKTVLSSNGEKLFRNAIPGIQSMAPSLFFVQQGTADTSARSWGTSLGDSYKARLLGPDGLPGGGDDNWIAGSIGGLADWLNIPYLLMIGLIMLGVCVYVIKKSTERFGTPIPGYIGSLIVVMCFSLLMIGFTVIALIGMALVIAAGWLLFMRRA